MIFEAFSIEEATKEAEKHFDCQKEKLEISVLVKPASKMLGMVKLRGKYEINPERIEETKVSIENIRLNGSISIKNGEITIKDPVGTGMKASILLRHPQASLLINGEPVTTLKTVGEEDTLSFQFEEIKPFARAQISFSEDEVNAYLTIIKEEGKRFSIADHEETLRADLKVKEEVIPAPAVTFQECISMLADFHVEETFVNQSALMQAVVSKGATKVLVASGKEPVESVKTRIYYCEEILVKDISEGLEPIVKMGTLLARKETRAQLGIPGITVKGKDITVAKVMDETLEVEDGAELRKDGIYALIDGRPYLKKGKIGVVPLLTVVGDLGKDNENIDFDGDVVVKGNVMDHMEIKASGNITILGSVYHSTLTAVQNVEVKGKIIGGRIRAGDQNVMYKAMLPLIEEMLEEIQLIFQGLKMEDGKGVKELMKTISQGQVKLETCLMHGEKLVSMLLDEEVVEFAQMNEQFEKCFREIKLLHKEGFEHLNDIYTQLFEKAEMMREEVSDERMVKVIYAQNAMITSSGDIMITGKGSYQSDLSAGREIKFESLASVVKGGNLIAGKTIRAGVVGTPGEIITFCQVLDREGEITGKFYKGTKLMVKNEVKEYLPVSS